MIRVLGFAIAVFLAACRSEQPGTVQSDNAGPTLALRNGANRAALFGDSTPGEIFVARRENGNAHGFSTVAFYVFASAQPGARDTTRTWQIIPFFGGPSDSLTGREVFRTFEGADCTLRDLRVVQHRGAPTEVVIANRQLGESFADSGFVSFEYYRLAHNDGGVPGLPTYYFEHVRSAQAKHNYCDVNDAFRRELGFGALGVGHGEGGR